MILFYFLVLLVCLSVCGFILLIFLFQIIAVFTTDAPFVPVPKEIEGEIVNSLKLTEGSVLYDLGCGDARVLVSAAKRYPDAKMVGIEVAFFPYIIARFKTRRFKHILIQQEDIFKTDVSEATTVFVYLYPKVLEKLMPILAQKCKPGTRIVSCDFEDKNRTATETILLNPLAKRGKKLIVYTI